MHDLAIRNGTIVDGSGKPAFTGDVAIDAGIIRSVGGKAGAARREIDAAGLLVAPGWVDIHTHYDGQVAWDPYLSPSSWHGVTTIVMGNCGVGFAPVQPGKQEFLIGLMEGVEDIPGDALAKGINWQWESFAEYLDALSAMKRAIDVGAQVPHGAVRAYVMGERGAHNEAATEEDIARMAAVVREALRAGAVGFSTSRTIGHRAKNGELVPGTYAAEDELLGLGRALGQVGHGVFEMASDLTGIDRSMEWMVKLSKETGRPVSFIPVHLTPDPMIDGRELLRQVREFNRGGARLVPQVSPRPTSLLMGLQSSAHPLMMHPTFRSLANLSFEERLARLRDPQVRARILAEGAEMKLGPNAEMLTRRFDNFFPLGDPPNYEPSADMSIAARAQREGKTPDELTYETLLQRNGTELIYYPLSLPLSNYADRNFDFIAEVLKDPSTRLSLSDGGAHCGLVCDASMPTFLLSYWVRDRVRGERIELERAIKLQTRDTAEFYGFMDRGLVAPGMKADLNLIDLANLRLHAPQMVFDFPAGARRLVQKADGYKHTIVSGEVTFEDGRPTGALPGKMIRAGA
ncbi:MAG TPA: amidohydrolase family protein [Candidatus Binataceae bacterium]|jgi:N-acyl-D-aspartate/D-glutamate deacylase|nr:amidohydrolase family protein [Candidatus Binataceae bacterium]